MAVTADTNCPNCRTPGAEIFYRQQGIPIHSCLLVAEQADALSFPRGDLAVAFCPSCAFIFNAAFEPERMRYSADYEETQAFSPRFNEFLAALAGDLVTRHGLEGKTGLEIGCGKGEFLVAMCEQGLGSAIGLDPGVHAERFEGPVARRIEFIADFYGEKYRHLTADFVACRHTLEHIPDTADFMDGVRRAIGDRPGTVVFFELPETRRVLREQAFWDLYYEHCSYFTAGSLSRVFRLSGFEVTHTWLDYDDQYLMLEAVPADGPLEEPFGGEEPVAEIRAEVDDFKVQVARRLESWQAELDGWSKEGQRVTLWGSGSKAVAYLNTLQPGEAVDCVVDINPYKHGRFMPGTGHAIVSPEHLQTTKPDQVVVMNPIYVDEIRADLDRLGVSARVSALGVEE